VVEAKATRAEAARHADSRQRHAVREQFCALWRGDGQMGARL
jgi:hypothetical protein